MTLTPGSTGALEAGAGAALGADAGGGTEAAGGAALTGGGTTGVGTGGGGGSATGSAEALSGGAAGFAGGAELSAADALSAGEGRFFFERWAAASTPKSATKTSKATATERAWLRALREAPSTRLRDTGATFGRAYPGSKRKTGEDTAKGRIPMSVDSDFLEDPVELFLAWYGEAVASGQPLPEAMTLSTATLDGRPSARMVLFKGMSQGGLTFHTNYESRKALELESNPRAAVVFYWPLIGRQVRLEGGVERLPEDESDAYFRTRDRSSQLGAWASPQSRPIASRAELDERLGELERRYENQQILRPPFWGGYRLIPERFEFWIGREHRLHDRVEYQRDGAVWRRTRLAP